MLPGPFEQSYDNALRIFVHYAEPKSLWFSLLLVKNGGTFRNDLEVSQSYLGHESLHLTTFESFFKRFVAPLKQERTLMNLLCEDTD
jgi:hypothetical protein